MAKRALKAATGYPAPVDERILEILSGLKLEADGIYSSVLPAPATQADEVREREAVARRTTQLLHEIGRHHSIQVMDREVRAFLSGIPAQGVLVDVGGGWGWHWRRLDVERRDVFVVVVDFVRENLRHAARMLGALVNEQVFLVHGDATTLPFPSSAFDGYWSVQALQHIPDFAHVVTEAKRVLRPNGRFACYSLNRARLIELVYRLSGRPYHVRGKRPGSFYLARGSAREAAVVEQVFTSPVTSRFTEVLFHPDFGLRTGGAASWIGRADACLSSKLPVFAWVARQRSYHARKPSRDC